MASALIVTAEIGSADFAWLDRLRRTHYPVERNRLPAHLTMFHALPPTAETELRARLSHIATRSAPKASIGGLLDLHYGVAMRIASPDLEAIREQLAADLHGLLSIRDRQGWRPHVTIQNKVAPKIARALIDSMKKDFKRRPLAVSGLGLHRYLGGPWERIAIYPFRGVR